MLSRDEGKKLKRLISQGKASARKIIHANLLIHADESATDPLKDADIADAIHISLLTVERIPKRFVEEGLESALNPKVQKWPREKYLDGEGEAFLVATACSKPPLGCSDWSLNLLTERLVGAWGRVDSIAGGCVSQTLNLKDADKELVDEIFRDKQIILVVDNLSPYKHRFFV